MATFDRVGWHLALVVCICSVLPWILQCFSTSIRAQATRQYGVLMFSLPTQATMMGWFCLFVLTGDCISLFGDMQLEAEWIVQLNFAYSLLLLENTINTIEKQPTSKISN